MMQEVKKLKRQHRLVSIPLLQSKLKMSFQEARNCLKTLVDEKKSSKKVSKNTRPS